MTAFNNEAYLTLSKESTLFPYVLGLHGIQLGDLTLTPDFLGEMMDINEEIAEIRMGQDLKPLTKCRQSLKIKRMP
ncbi:MAG: hypothetical protein IPH36_01020 [Saprospiraceae bacterium]|nr:hypothetical protein [Saprospiraceae bacterium]